jgi:hypothetical protein
MCADELASLILTASLEARKVLKPNEFQNFDLKEKKVLSHNTAMYVFPLPQNDGMGIGNNNML